MKPTRRKAAFHLNFPRKKSLGNFMIRIMYKHARSAFIGSCFTYSSSNCLLVVYIAYILIATTV